MPLRPSHDTFHLTRCLRNESMATLSDVLWSCPGGWWGILGGILKLSLDMSRELQQGSRRGIKESRVIVKTSVFARSVCTKISD